MRVFRWLLEIIPVPLRVLDSIQFAGMLYSVPKSYLA